MSQNTLKEQLNQSIKDIKNSFTAFSFGKIFQFVGMMGVSYYLTISYIIDAFPSLFLIANRTSIFYFYLFVLFLGLFLLAAFDYLIKVLIYISK